MVTLEEFGLRDGRVAVITLRLASAVITLEHQGTQFENPCSRALDAH